MARGLTATPSAWLISRTASMMRAGSQSLGQRALQVSQVRQSQIDSSCRALSRGA